jgi:sterol desaturase/sphingolipid hydroxylase (fatty acid hydroxylase superfamily)
MVLYQFVMWPLAIRVTGNVRISYLFPVVWAPLAVRVVVYYLLADLGSYWLHRVMHSRFVWSVHRFHHSVNDMYWLAGVRGTLPQQIVFNLPYIFVAPLLVGAHPWVYTFFMVEGIVRNHWQHANIGWQRLRWMEYLLVTPRYHHLHHSADHRGNYGSLFTIWDRMFGTRLDPDVEKVRKFGTGEPKKRDPVLMIIGV